MEHSTTTITEKLIKTTNILIICLMFGAFCISPAMATSNIEVYEPKGVTHWSDDFIDKSDEEYKWLLDLKSKYPESWTELPYAYMGLTNCLKPNGEITRCELHDTNDPENPHPIWADWLELEYNYPVKVLVDAMGAEYALIYPPKDESINTEKPWFLPGANAVAPAFVVGLGYLIAEITPRVAIYTLGIVTTAGITSIAAENFEAILQPFTQQYKAVQDHVTYLITLKYTKPTKNNHDFIEDDDRNIIKENEKEFRDHSNLAKHATVTIYKTKADKDNGCPKQRTYYDKDGKKDYEIDFHHQDRNKNHIFPHVHKWVTAPKSSVNPKGNPFTEFRVGIDSTPASIKAEYGVIITEADLAPFLSEVQILTQTLMNTWNRNKCKDYDHINHRYKHTEF